MSQSQNNHPGEHPGSGSAWRQIAGGLLGGAIVLVTVLGSIILATQEAPSTPTSVVIISPTPVIEVTWPPSATPAPSLTPGPIVPIQPTVTLAPECEIPPGWMAYTVRAGDTLAGIARSRGTDEFVLIQGNCLTETELVAGQTLYVPPPPTRGPTPIPTPCGPPRGWVVYRVQPGDTLYGLSRRYQTTVQALALANCLTTYTLRVGQPLYVPPTPVATWTPRPTFTAQPAASDTPTPTAVPSDTPPPSPTWTPGPSETPTLYPTDTPVPTWTPQPTETLWPTPVATDTPLPTATVEPVITPSLTPAATFTPGP